MIELVLSYPPSLNTYWRHIVVAGKPRVLLSAAGRRYADAVARETIGHRVELAGRLALSIRLYPPDKRKSDIDNRLKALLDALQYSRVFLDDSQIDQLTVVRCEIVRKGRAIVEINEISSEATHA